ncbi:MAG: membrane protein insertase YidC [Steroidobacteraceae bacterium]|nr:membrane protein insertase YidC [Steroidobacteraceae bacterium]
MDNQRLFIWIALLFILWLNFEAWNNKFSPPPAATQSAAGTTAGTAAAPGATGVPGAPAATGPSGVPTVPAAPGAAAPAAGTPSAPAVTSGLASFPPQDAPSIRVRTDVLDVVISTVGGQITRAELPEYPVAKDRPDEPVVLFNKDSNDTAYVFQSGLATGNANAEPNHNARYTAAASEYTLAAGQDELVVPLTWTDGQGLEVTKTFTFRRGQYGIALAYDVKNGGATPWRAAPYAQFVRHWFPVEKSMWNPETYAYLGPAIWTGEKYERLDVEDEANANFQLQVTDGWIAAMQHHFVAAVVPKRDQAQQYSLTVKDMDFLLRTFGPPSDVAPGATARFEQAVFVGPKLQAQLEELHPELNRVADYGMLTIIAQPLFWLLSQVHKFVGNWGWAIIIVTLLIKLVFYKLAETSGRSMAKMRNLAPRMKDIQEKYKDDREQLGRAMMELYKREKINPVAGCLPILVQIPVFIAFYWVLLESVEMRQAPWMLWINDLSVRDPYFILPILMGIAMYGQFKLNPAPPDPMQAKIFAFMPVVMTVMMAFFPAGLVLYWITNTVLSIAQQWRINKVVEREDKERRK